LRPKFASRAAPMAGALCLASGCAAALVPTAARSQETQGTNQTAGIARVAVSDRRLNVRAGSRAVVTGTVRHPGRVTVALQIRRGGRWLTLDRARTSARGRYVLRDRVRRPMSAVARVSVVGAARGGRALGRLNVYRHALASWYGPGFYGRRTGCGGRLGSSELGVAHKTLPCGAKVTLRHRGRSVRVPVIDRGPYSGAREFDLTASTARRIGFRAHGSVMVTR
jgi:rare lipoprotein A